MKIKTDLADRCRLALRPAWGAMAFLAVVGCGAMEPTPKENTVFPEGFIVQVFDGIQIGDKWEEAHDRLGDPFHYIDIPEGHKRYLYSKPADRTFRYAAYDIAVDPKGIVVQKSVIYLYLE